MRFVFALTFFVMPFTLLGWLIWSHYQCHVPDPAMKACSGKVSHSAVRRCVSTRVPPSTELQPDIPSIKRAFAACEKRIKENGEEAVMPYLDSTLAVIGAEHGRSSVPYAYALAQVITVLASAGDRFDLIRPYSEASISVSRNVYGTNHRETAIALHTHADVLLRLNKDEYDEDAIPLMREAWKIRRRVLGNDHEETVSAATKLARLLLNRWYRAEDRKSQRRLLEEARRLSEHAAAVFRRAKDRSEFGRIRAEALLGRIAYAQGNFEKAVTHFQAAFYDDNPLTNLFSCSFAKDACREFALALRKLDRDEEAAKVEERLKKVR